MSDWPKMLYRAAGANVEHRVFASADAVPSDSGWGARRDAIAAAAVAPGEKISAAAAPAANGDDRKLADTLAKLAALEAAATTQGADLEAMRAEMTAALSALDAATALNAVYEARLRELDPAFDDAAIAAAEAPVKEAEAKTEAAKPAKPARPKKAAA